MEQELGRRVANGEPIPGAVIHDLADMRSRHDAGAPLTSAEAGAPCDSSEERSERVFALKAAIADGSYTPDPEAIARTLLDRGL